MSPPYSQLLLAAHAHDFPARARLLKSHQLPLYTYIVELIRADTTAFALVKKRRSLNVSPSPPAPSNAITSPKARIQNP